VQYIEDVEDAVQSALMTALETWTITDLPDNPSAWLFRVAHNNVMGELRRRTGRRRILEQNVKGDIGTLENGPEIFLAGEVRDDLLRMLFVCCDEAILVESQLVLALKTLCGFEIREIALRLFASEANVYKRLGRARSRLRELPLHPGELTGEQYAATACRTQDSLPCIHRGLPLFPRRNGYPSGALRRSDTAGYDPGRTSGGSDSGNVRPVGADASARGADDRSSGQLRRVAPVGGAGARALGPAKDSGRIGVVGQIRTRR
jgi:RNA polymerase sigma factor (sigma-70 family)